MDAQSSNFPHWAPYRSRAAIGTIVGMVEFLEWFFSTIWPWVLAATHVGLLLVASAHVVLTKRDPRAAMGWVGIIWLTPILGTILYVMFGVNRIRRKARTLLAGTGKAGRTAAQAPVRDEVLYSVLGDDAPHLAALPRLVERLTHLPLLDGNRIEPIVGGKATYDAMLAAIGKAKHSVALMSYIFDNDECGQWFVDALAAAKQRGIEVRVLIDDVGARYTFPSITRKLRKAGVKCATFLPTLFPGKLHYTNLRNHRKILVVDGHIGFTGGMNIRAGHLCKPGDKHPVADQHFSVLGPVVAHLMDTFAFDWEFSTGERLKGECWFPPIDAVGETLCRGITGGPDQRGDILRLTILGAIGCARHRIDIVTPYFLPEQPMITALNVAAMRGVDVNIILPQQGNLALVQWASTAQLWQVLERGCRVWLTPPPFDHTKLMIVDGTWSFIGSANWDSRSLRLNFEFNVECYDRELAAGLGGLVQRKLSIAHETSLAEVDSRPVWKRLRDGVCRLALPYL